MRRDRDRVVQGVGLVFHYSRRSVISFHPMGRKVAGASFVFEVRKVSCVCQCPKRKARGVVGEGGRGRALVLTGGFSVSPACVCVSISRN